MMRKTLLILIATLLLGNAALHAQDTPEADPMPSDGITLAIYNQGTALVLDRRTLTLDAGINTIDFTDVAASIDPTSVTFVSLTDRETYVVEQSYLFDLVGRGALLERYLDETIEIVADDGTTYRGQLLSGRGGEIILRADEGGIVVIGLDKVRDLRFPSLPGGLITRPTLRWLIESQGDGDQQVQLTYLTGGLNWTADYNILLAADNTRIDLNGWVTLTNTSGTTFTDAIVKLVAGDVNRLPEPVMFASMLQETAMMRSDRPGNIEQRDISEYKLYAITRPVTVADNETKQVEFVTGAGIPATTFYVYDSSAPYFGYEMRDPGYGTFGRTDVQTYLEFNTGDDGGLGAALPAGRIRIYQSDTDGGAVLVGENRIDHTAKGEDVRVFMGNAFDLIGERRQVSFNALSANVIEETWEITLRNRKERDSVEVRVPEHLFRYTNWEILSASEAYTQLDANTIEFRPTVAAGGEVKLTYTVRYTFPR